jgi:predicted RNA-binding Zn-ribbon protein involved in translation (DUF1610 family)
MTESKAPHETLGGVIEEASKVKDCPRCGGAAGLIVPLKKVDKRMAVYGCQACGHAFSTDGGAFVKDAGELRDVFRGASLANRTLTEALGGEKLNPATRAVLTAQLLEYGMQMYFDGLKQGLILGTIQAEKERAGPT